jgi:hypothetical protein
MATNNATPKPKKAKKGIFDSIKTKLILVMLRELLRHRPDIFHQNTQVYSGKILVL